MATQTASVTFKLHLPNGENVAPPTREPNSVSLENVLNGSDVVTQKQGKLMFTSTRSDITATEKIVNAGLSNSFVGALYAAYSGHYKLVLRPDDVWITIATAFADYIDFHAEEMRKTFVSHEGKKQLIVVIGSLSAYADAIRQFSDLIDQNTHAGVRDWIEPRFSTTTSNDSLIARTVLMGAMKHYFSYGMRIECGIPEVTLMGTLKDWLMLRAKVDHLGSLGQEQLGWWRDVLLPIVDKFIESYKNPTAVDHAFWQSCANYIGGGSGPSYISGWVLAFSPFKKGEWRIDHPQDIAITGKYGQIETTDFKTSATVQVPVKVLDNGREYDSYFYAGGIVNRYDSATNTLRPSFDFAMFEMPPGTIGKEDNIDWNKNSKPVKKVTPKSDLLKGRPKEIQIPQHKHTLKLQVLFNNRCDVCRARNLEAGYHCDECDYDCCFKCSHDCE